MIFEENKMVSLWKIICISLTLFIQCIDCKRIDLLRFILFGKNSDFNKYDNKDHLLFAHTFCRHGDRNIEEAYPNDPYKSENNWPGGFGQLTNIEKQQEYELGQYLRKRYANLIGDGRYSPNKVYVESTDYDRVLESAEAALAGMFPPLAGQKWNRHLRWQPIPVHTRPNNEEYRLNFAKPCDRYSYFLQQYLNRIDFEGSFAKYKPLIAFLEQNSGLKLRTIKDVSKLYDTLYIERLKFKKLPAWANEVLMPNGDFQYISLLNFILSTPKIELKKLISGFLLKEILDHFSNKTQSILSPNRSLWMYFDHDFTIANMLSSLELVKPNFPPYASCLFFELYDSKDAPYVQIFYRNTTTDYIPPLEIPNCGAKCPLTKLYDLYKNILPTQSFEEECALRDGEQKTNKSGVPI